MKQHRYVNGVKSPGVLMSLQGQNKIKIKTTVMYILGIVKQTKK